MVTNADADASETANDAAGSASPTETEARLQLLLRASELLGASLDFTVTLANLATLLVPSMADGYVVDLVESGGEIRRITAVDVNPAKAPLSEALKSLGAINPKAPNGIQRVLAEGRSVLTEVMTDEGMQTAARDAHHLAIMRGLELRSGLIVPLKTRGRTVGLLWLYYSTSGRRYAPSDLAFLEEIAARAALAIDNARLLRETEEAVRAREEFLAIASHELRTPITSLVLRVQGYQRALGRHPERVPARDEVLQWLSHFNGQVGRISRLIDEMLDVSVLTSGRLVMHGEPVDLGETARRVGTALHDEARRAGSALTVTTDGPLVGQWDAMRVQQVVTNLVSNAIKYGEGGPVDVITRREGDSAVLAVKDEGIGIAAADLEQIFERFERRVSSRNYGGFGLGLWVARKIVQAWGGTIRAESAPGKGSTFRVDLPLGESATR